MIITIVYGQIKGPVTAAIIIECLVRMHDYKTYSITKQLY